MLLTAACTRQKKLNEFVSLWRKDKIPYGTYYAFENLSALFPHALINVNTETPRNLSYLSLGSGEREKKKIFMVLGRRIIPEPRDIESMIRYASAGHQVFLCAFTFGDSLLRALHLKTTEDFIESEGDSLRLSIYEPLHHDSISYVYPGRCLDRMFSAYDTLHTEVLGRNYHGKPDFIRISYRNGGAIFVHLAPMAFTNFFLLHKQNKTYYDYALSYLPTDAGELYWDDFYRYNRVGDFSALHFLLSNQALRWACWLTLLLFVILYLVETKRKQRSLKIIAPPGNASVDFVKTIGRLYLQQKDNHNLALKMISAFLEQLRSDYNIPTAQLDEEFSKKLTLRSGKSIEEVRQLVDRIHALRLQPAVSDGELMDLYNLIESFNKT